MSALKSIYGFLLVMSMMHISCSKKDGLTGSGGDGIVKGSITFQVSVMHHSWGVGGVSVFLKKDATEWPGRDTTIYDARVVADQSGNAVFQNLFPGNYYVYAVGFDSIWGANVMGYNPVTLNSSTVTNNEAYFTLLVSE